jgi:hypothetical protein
MAMTDFRIANADLVLWSPDGRPARTWGRGAVVYERAAA